MSALVRVSRLSCADLGALVVHPARDCNKYTRGFLEIVGGDAAYPGAACLAADAALRSGAGYVEVACSADAVSHVRALNPDAVVRSWDGWSCDESRLGASGEGVRAACLIGSGMVADAAETRSLLADVLGACAHPVVVDGGALSALAALGANVCRERYERGWRTVLTPHFGEARRLADACGIHVGSICEGGACGADCVSAGCRVGAAGASEVDAACDDACVADALQVRAEFALALADAYSATVALKGPCTLVASPRLVGAKSQTGLALDAACCEVGDVRLMDWGTPALAKAGTGDVLAGIVASLLAQGLGPEQAASLGCGLHAEAARFAACELTDVCVRAADLSRFFPHAVRRFDEWAAL